MREAVMQAFVYILQALIVIVGGYIIAYLKAKVGQQKLNIVLKVAEQVVKATEQIYANVKGAGNNKKELAVKFLMDRFKLTEKEAEMFVEAAVRELKVLELEATKDIKQQ
ncbi:phage holin, LL-H family [Caldicellulosiruptor hydrothermalis 108]|uniref:Phage holin, LL-H family n=1 Tax=Caldicellulosiruptor hydrothermalis (strain DSM 18901 / VKM B-2411 / 108) TaxID=632292 RepID=E4QE33_CALH1|nr:phage holin, LLH family [Caldicellulosiruptor hydrothermalis]ADQ06527.1 phage holin, LL-H family [Caldicellulosiruptor hydrothermalis 108]